MNLGTWAMVVCLAALGCGGAGGSGAGGGPPRARGPADIPAMRARSLLTDRQLDRSKLRHAAAQVHVQEQLDQAHEQWRLLAAASALEPAIVGIAAEHGAGSTIFHRDAAFPAMQRYLASEPYQAMLAELRKKV